MMKWKKLLAGVAAVGFVGSGALAGDPNRVVVDGSTTVGPVAKAFAEYYMKKNPGVTINVSESGSGNGAKGLINGVLDVGTMSRAMKESEIKAAADAGILAVPNVIAMDGIAVVVHPSNPVKALTLDQVRDVYMGKISNWKELGGPDQPIVVVSRETNSGTYETFETMVLKAAKMSEKAEYVGSNGAIRQRVMSTPGAVGYVGLAFLDGVKALSINGVEPSQETVLAKTYPISRPLYMYTSGRPKEGTHVYNYVMLYKSADGRKIIEDIGFVPLAQ